MSFMTKILPSKFIGILPLYIGVELILLYGIINKMCGPYGLLSLLTGHPINFIQWLYYLWSTGVMVFFIWGFKTVHKPEINTFAVVTMVYLIDTAAGCVFTLYFVWFWFTHEGAKESTTEAVTASATSSLSASATKAAVHVADALAQGGGDVVHIGKRVTSDLASQSASEGYELFMTISLTAITTLVRFYFLLVLLSFFKQMMNQSKYNSRFRLSTTTGGSRFKTMLVRLEVVSYNLLNRLVN